MNDDFSNNSTPRKNMASHPRIFICYRRNDSDGWAGRIADRLIAEFGRDSVFFDIDSIQPGSDFLRSLNNRTAECDVLLAVIGRGWLNARDTQDKRRLDDPKDFVRMEIRTALTRGVRVIPLLVSQADMPQASDLPDELAALAYRGAVKISDLNFHQAMAGLIPVLVQEGAKRPAYDLPKHPTRTPQTAKVRNHSTLTESLTALARVSASVYPWMLRHKTVTLALTLLAAVALSSLWYPFNANQAKASPDRPSIITQQIPTEQPKAAIPSKETPPAFRNFCLVIKDGTTIDRAELKAALESNPDFHDLHVDIVDDPALAGAFLEVSQSPAGDFLFEWKTADAGSVILTDSFVVTDGHQPIVAEIAAAIIQAARKAYP